MVVAAVGQPDRYLVIDGYKRIAALQQLGRDTVEAVVWPMSEAEALLLDRSLRLSEQETALEQGWLLAELEQRFGYGLEELARRFDRSVSWVSRRLALVELLPETIQQQVREGKISAHVAMKFLVPVARINAGGLRADGRDLRTASLRIAPSRAVVCRLAQWLGGDPQAHPRCAGSVLQNAAASGTESRRAGGRRGIVARSGDGGGDREPRASPPGRRGGDGDGRHATANRRGGRAERAINGNSAVWRSESKRSEERMLSQAQRTTILELHTQGVGKREIARVLGVSRSDRAQSAAVEAHRVPELHRPEKAEPYREQILELFGNCKGNLVRVHEELVAGGAELSYPALTGFCRRHGIGQTPVVAGRPLRVRAGEEMQHDTSPHEVQLGGKKRKVQTASAVLCYSRMLFFQCLPDLSAFRLQGISHRRAALLLRQPGPRDDR